MNDGDKGYYEIQMDNKQLAFVFVGAVVLLVFIFLLGVHTGRGVRQAEEESAQQEKVSALPPAPQLEETKPTQDLEFFQQYQESAKGAPEDSAPAASPAPATSPPPATSETAPPASAAPPPAREVPVAAMRPPEPTPAPAAAGGSGFVIQVLSTADQTKANTLLGQLRSRGFPAFIQPASTGSATTYRVRVGPFASRQAAAEKNEELKAQVGITDTWITSQ